jgi:beta-mannosidase
MAFYAIARELRDVTFGISRTGCKSGQNAANLDVWGVNSTLSNLEVDLKLQLFSIQSGKILLEKQLEHKLLPNQATEVLKEFDISDLDTSDVVASVVYKHPITREMLRSSADWPQPRKYIHFPNRHVEFSVHGDEVHVRAELPTKGVILDIEGDDDEGILWSDNGFDIMSSETVVVHAKGISGRKVLLSWYGGT